MAEIECHMCAFVVSYRPIYNNSPRPNVNTSQITHHSRWDMGGVLKRKRKVRTTPFVPIWRLATVHPITFQLMRWKLRRLWPSLLILLDALEREQIHAGCVEVINICGITAIRKRKGHVHVVDQWHTSLVIVHNAIFQPITLRLEWVRILQRSSAGALKILRSPSAGRNLLLIHLKRSLRNHQRRMFDLLVNRNRKLLLCVLLRRKKILPQILLLIIAELTDDLHALFRGEIFVKMTTISLFSVLSSVLDRSATSVASKAVLDWPNVWDELSVQYPIGSMLQLAPISSPPRSSLLYYQVEVNRMPAVAMFDTGASQSFITYDLADQLQASLTPLKESLITVDFGGQKSSIEHTVQLSLRLTSISRMWTFYVSKNAPAPIVLGLDLVLEWPLFLNPRDRCLYVPLSSSSKKMEKTIWCCVSMSSGSYATRYFCRGRS